MLVACGMRESSSAETCRSSTSLACRTKWIVFYQFERAGITHKVAIECKDHGRPIENGEVAKFFGKMCNAGSQFSAAQAVPGGVKENSVLLKGPLWPLRPFGISPRQCESRRGEPVSGARSICG